MLHIICFMLPSGCYLVIQTKKIDTISHLFLFTYFYPKIRYIYQALIADHQADGREPRVENRCSSKFRCKTSTLTTVGKVRSHERESKDHSASHNSKAMNPEVTTTLIIPVGTYSCIGIMNCPSSSSTLNCQVSR